MKFVIQTINNKIRGIEEYILVNLIDNSPRYLDMSYILSERADIDDFTDYTPVGSIEFVGQHLKEYYGIEYQNPIEIPKEMRNKHYVGRFYSILPIDKLPNRGFSFIKDVSRLKSYVGLMAITEENKKYLTGEIYQISEYTPFMSEYRVFVLKGNIQAIQHYKEDVTIFPNVEVIKEIIRDYENTNNASSAYTVDIGITEDNRTLLIEIHTFASCGTYGFYGSSLFDMYKNGYEYLIKNNKKIDID